eukprot:966040-Pelagomonas_calceolata.AAC.3
MDGEQQQEEDGSSMGRGPPGQKMSLATCQTSGENLQTVPTTEPNFTVWTVPKSEEDGPDRLNGPFHLNCTANRLP